MPHISAPIQTIYEIDVIWVRDENNKRYESMVYTVE